MAGLRRRKKGKERPISHVNSQTSLYTDDEREVAKMISASGRTRADILRDLVTSGLRAQRFRAFGKEEALSDVIDAQKSVVSAALAPLVGAITDEKNFVEESVRLMHIEYVSIEERLTRIELASGQAFVEHKDTIEERIARIEQALAFLIKGFDRIIHNIVLIRALIWQYIFEFFYTVLASTGKGLTPAQLQRNYEDRLKDIKIEAARERNLCGEVAFEKAVNVVSRNLVRDARNPPGEPPAALQNPPTTGS